MKIDRIEFRNLSFNYDKNKNLLSDVSFQFPLHQNVLVDGPSGDGKSTLLRILSGLIAPSDGQYFINDYDISDMSFEEFLPIRRHIGYTFDFGGILNNRTLYDNLMLPLLYHNEIPYREANARVTRLMQQFRIWEHKDKRPASVSGASRKTCCVIRGFVMNPSLLLLDDPFVALDAYQTSELRNLIAEQRAQGTLQHLFFTSRDYNSIAGLDYVKMYVQEQKVSMKSQERKVASL